jgi:hypothetical protein
MSDPIELPKVEHVTGLWFDGEAAELQFKSAEQVYKLRFPLEEVLRSEDWFISLRRSLAPLLAARKDVLSTRIPRMKRRF